MESWQCCFAGAAKAEKIVLVWFAAREPIVQAAIVALLGALATSLVALLTSFVNAVSRAQDRKHESKMKKLERLLDKRAESAEGLIEQLNTFYRVAFDDLDALKAINDDFIDELKGITWKRLRHSDFPSDEVEKLADSTDAAGRANFRLETLRRALIDHHYKAVAWLRYDTAFFWAWFHEAAKIKKDVRILSDWYNAFYFELKQQLAELERKYEHLPTADPDGKLDLSRVSVELISDLDAFTEKLDQRQDVFEVTLSDEMLRLQQKLTKFLA